ncbi:MAG: beta-CASP ribonuclease aCPSF1 [Thaumarchaeota archaeon]|nr:MAG: beta-CASP ribonuclease aCPSF1 [Nitrososphaerota archaeon]
MYDRVQDEGRNQNIVATILNNIPSESEITKIEYEGPFIVLYSRKPTVLLENQEIISKMVNSIKKRIVIRTDTSIRSSEQAVHQILRSSCSYPNDLSEIFFDSALGEATIFVSDFRTLTELNRLQIQLVEKTGWKLLYRRAPKNLKLLKSINEILYSSSEQRMYFYKRVGEKIFRQKLSGPEEASIVCLGGFSEIGRSAILVVTHESKILLDFGIKSYDHEDNDILPRLDIYGIGMNEIDAVIISHAHLDHCGAVPILFKYGYDGPVYCTDPTFPIMISILQDYISRSKEPLYSTRDIESLITHVIPLNFGAVTDISPDVRITFANSGHMIGSASTHMHIGNGDHNIVYTGDLKFGRLNTVDNAFWNFPRAETLVIESTNGNRDDKFVTRDVAEENLVKSINSTIEEGGRLLIPVPIIGLSQEVCVTLGLLRSMNKINPDNIFVDEKILDMFNFYEIYSDYLSKILKQRISEQTEDPLFINSLVKLEPSVKWERSIILCPSSMLTSGPSVTYLSEIANDPLSKVILLSEQFNSTVGKLLQEGERNITIERKSLEIKCKIDVIQGFSIHSDYNQLLAYINRLKPKLKKVITNHGEGKKCQNLSNSINKIFKIQSFHPLVQESIKVL